MRSENVIDGRIQCNLAVQKRHGGEAVTLLYNNEKTETHHKTRCEVNTRTIAPYKNAHCCMLTHLSLIAIDTFSHWKAEKSRFVSVRSEELAIVHHQSDSPNAALH